MGQNFFGVNYYLANNSVSTAIYRNPLAGTKNDGYYQRFTGTGDTITGFYWYYTAAKTSTASTNLRFALWSDSAGVPKCLGDAPLVATAMRGLAVNTLYYKSFPSSRYCTAGVTYWISVAQNAALGAIAGFQFDLLPSAQPNPNYLLYSTGSYSSGHISIATANASYNKLVKKTGINFSSSTGYRLNIFPAWKSGASFLGQPYKSKNTRNLNSISNSYQYFYSDAAKYVNAGIYIVGKNGNPKPLRIAFCSTDGAGTFKSTSSQIIIVSTAKYVNPGWYSSSAIISPTYINTAKQRAIAIISSGDASNYWTIYDLVSPFIKLSFDSSYSYVRYGGSELNANDFPCRFQYWVATASAVGYVREYSMSSPFPGTKVKFHTGTNYNQYVASAVTDNTGKYTLTFPVDKAAKIFPTKYDFDFVPQYYKVNITGIDAYGAQNKAATTLNFISSSESLWWGGTSMSHRGKMWAFRQKINFATPHQTYNNGYTVKVSLKTGNTKRISNLGYFNESVQHNSNGIIYANGKTHCVWLTQNAFLDIAGATYDWNSKSWTSVPLVSSGIYGGGGAYGDSHYYPNLTVDPKGYLYLAKGGHNLQLEYLYVVKSHTANDLNSFPKGATAGKISVDYNTYARMKYTPHDDKLAIVLRRWADHNNASGSYHTCSQRLLLLTTADPPALVSEKNLIEYDKDLHPTIYCGGFQVDSDDTYHIVYVMQDGYLQTDPNQKPRCVGYMYSPYEALGPQRRYWYNIWGHTVAATFPNVNSCYPLRFHSDGSQGFRNSVIVYNWDSAHALANANSWYATNGENLFIHPYKLINNGKHIIHAPYFVLGQGGYAANFPNGSNVIACFFDSAYTRGNWPVYGSAKPLLGWVFHTVNSQSVSGVQTYSWGGRNVGAIAIDDTPTVRIFGFIKPSASGWYGAELCEWYSNDGHIWKTVQRSSNSSNGIPMIVGKPDYSNKTVELIYGRGNQIFYYTDYDTFPRIKSSGNDIRIVYASGASNAVEIDHVADNYNFSSSNVYFELKHTIPSNWAYHTQGNYYMYYGRYDTAQAFSGPNPDNPMQNAANTMLFYEGFEGYQSGYDITHPAANRQKTIGNAIRISTDSIQDVQVSNSASLNFTGRFSLEAWVKTTNTHTAYIVSKDFDTGSDDVEWAMYHDPTNGISAKIKTTVKNSVTTINDGNWHHVVVVVNGSNWKFYIDGTNVSNPVSAVVAANTNSRQVRIGTNRSGNNRFGGDIDGVKVYSSALGVNAILGNYANGYGYAEEESTILSADKRLLLSFDESSGSTCYDRSGNANNGTINSATRVPGKIWPIRWRSKTGYGSVSANAKTSSDIGTFKIHNGQTTMHLGGGGGYSTTFSYLPTASGVCVRFGWYAEASGSSAFGVILEHSTNVYRNYGQFEVRALSGDEGKQIVFKSPLAGSWTSSAFSSTNYMRPTTPHEFIFYLHTTYGCSLYNEKGIRLLANHISSDKAYNLIPLHTVNKITFYGTDSYFDNIRYYKCYSTPLAVDPI